MRLGERIVIDIYVNTPYPEGGRCRCGNQKMHFETIIWDLDHDPEGNVQHLLRRHGITKEEFEEVVRQVDRVEPSRNSAHETAVGMLPDGRIIRVIFERVDATTIYPVTAFQL